MDANYFKRTTAAGVMAVVVEEGWAPLTNEIWIYGSDDDTLFRLITLGTGSLSPGDAFQKQGFVRKGSESVVGPMPPYGEIITRENDIWKIIAWIRSKNCERDSARC